MSAGQLSTLRTYNVALVNRAAGNGDGDRSTQWSFKGQDADQTEHTMAQVQVAHSGTGADGKGKLAVKVNTGSALENRLTVDTEKVQMWAPTVVPQLAINTITLRTDASGDLVVAPSTSTAVDSLTGLLPAQGVPSAVDVPSGAVLSGTMSVSLVTAAQAAYTLASAGLTAADTGREKRIVFTPSTGTTTINVRNAADTASLLSHTLSASLPVLNLLWVTDRWVLR